jgi:U-box domain
MYIPGHSYERSKIQEWLTSNNNRSPMTNAVLAHKNLLPNYSLKALIDDFISRQGSSGVR